MVKGKANRRGEILQAAERLMRSHGLAGVTTRQISKEVGCSEGALYVHFKGRVELLLAMLDESLPDMLEPLQALRKSVGKGSPRKNLMAAMGGVFKFHQRIVPSVCGLFAEPELLSAYRESLSKKGKGPHLSMAVLADYLAAEQRMGRVEREIDARLAASLLMASSFFRAFMEEFARVPMQPSWDQFLKRLVATIIPSANSLPVQPD